MSLETLRETLLGQAGQGQIRISAAAFTAAGLQPPADLDARLKKAFVDSDPAAGLAISATQADFGPIEDGRYFTVSGKANLQIARDKAAPVRFAATGDQGELVIGIELGDSWNLGQSFPSLTGQTFAGLRFRQPYYFFAGQPEAGYPWSGTTVRLEPGLNFAGHLQMQGYLAVVAELLSGFNPQPTYVLSGTLDPSREVRQTATGKKYSYPGLRLATASMTDAAFPIGHLTVRTPSLAITLVDYGPGIGPAPAVLLAAQLEIPGRTGNPPVFRAALPTRPGANLVAFDLVEPTGGLVLTADELFALMAGQTWFGTFPPALSAFMQNFGFRSLGAVVSYENGLQVDSLEAVVASGTPWQVLEDPPLTLGLELDWTLMAPLQAGQSQYAALTATAQFMPDLFPGQFEFTIDTDLVIFGGYTARDPSEYISFHKLVAAVTGGLIRIPPQYVDIAFEEFLVTVNQPARFYALSATTSLKLPVLGPGTFELHDVTVTLSVQRPQGSGGGGTQYTGSISGNLVIGPLYLLAEGSYADETWTFALAMQPGTELGLQDLLDAVFDGFQLPTDIFHADLRLSDISFQAIVPTGEGQGSQYAGGGTIRWELELLGQSIRSTARVALAYRSGQTPSPYSGSVTATTTFDIFGVGATFTIGYEMTNQPGNREPSRVLFINWEGLTARYVQGSGQKTLEFTAGATWNLGRLIKALVRLVEPAANRELPTPWNLLNDVSLAGLKISFQLDTRTVTVSWPLNLDLFFGKIQSIDIVKTPGQQVNVTLKGDFKFIQGDSVAWDAVNQDPPEVPGGGNSALDLRLLAVGQRVTVPGLSQIQSVGDAVNQLAGFPQPAAASRELPIGPGIPTSALPPAGVIALPGADPPPPQFAADNNWLVGTHLYALSNTLELKAIFNDPVLYGLYIGLAGARAKIFAGLKFEILYKKVTDSIGMYKVMLKLPDQMRYLQFGQVTVILPVVGVEIYTNGNFKVDFGFPYHLDFSTSFTVQVFPFTGSGGFYFGILDGATSSQVPRETPCGHFTPVVEFGVGLQVGLGKSLSAGVLRAELAVTVFGILEGVVAAWRAYSQEAIPLPGATAAPDGHALVAAGGADMETAYYYKVTGTLGVIGKLAGVVDFAIVKAGLNLTVYAYVQGTFEAYYKTLVTVAAGVKVSLSLQINCGLFKITVHLAFSARIKEQLPIGSDHPQDAPWYCGGQSQAPRPLYAAPAPAMSLMEAVQRYAANPDFSPLKTPSHGQLTLDIFFVPQLSMAGTGSARAAQAAVYSANLFISNQPRSENGQTYQSFARLMRDTFLWITACFSGETNKGTPDAELQKTTGRAQLQAALAYLAANADGRALTYPAVAANLAALFRLHVQLPPEAAGDDAGGPPATAFAMPPELALKATYQDQVLADVDFSNWVTADDAYLQDLQERINRLLAQLLDELERRHDPDQEVRQRLRGEPAAAQSLAQFVFTDTFAMAARYLVQSALDALDNYAYPLQDGDSIAGIRAQFNQMGDGGRNRLTDARIAWANRTAPLTGGLHLLIDGIPDRILDGDTWGGIANARGLDPGQMAGDNAAVPLVLRPGQELTVSGATHPVPNDGTLAATAALFGISPAALGAAIAGMQGVLSPLTVITLNGVPYTTAPSGDTIAGLAQSYGIDVATLTPSLAGVANLFNGTEQAAILLPGLDLLTNQQLWDDLTTYNGVEHLSGMFARFLLHGLRLPVAGLHFRQPAHACAQAPTCGLQILTGQQFSLPSLQGYDPQQPLQITLANPRGLTWVTFANPVNPSDHAQLVFNLPVEAATQVNELVQTAKGAGLQAPIDELGPLALAEERARRYIFKSHIILQAAQPLPLPSDDLPPNAARRPRIWQFPPALLAGLGRPAALAPQFVVGIGATAEEGGRLVGQPARAYGFGTLVNVAVKRLAATGAGHTYELVGADDVGVNLLERLLAVIRPDDTGIINGIYLLYPPNQASDRAQGLQYDGEETYTAFLVQANFSTETNPPTQVPAGLRAGVDEPRGLLGGHYAFISRLWAGSIVRSGGYYLYYQLPGGGGLPDSLFSADQVAQIAVLIVYNPVEGVTGDAGGILLPFMNVTVIDDAVDTSHDVVYLQSHGRPVTVTPDSQTSLQGLAGSYHTGVVAIAAANANHPLSTTATLTVTDIIHQVGRGESLASIARYFGTTEQAIRDANPHVDFQHLAAGTGLHIPDLATRPAAGSPGLTLAEIARHLNTTVAALAWANRTVPGLFTAEPPLTFTDQLRDKQSTLSPGNVGLRLVRQNPGENAADPAVYLEQQYNLLGYDPVTNTDFDFATLAGALPLPAGPADDEEEQQVAQPKLAAPALDTQGQPWVYTFVVPAARAARNNPVPGGSDYPDREMNPYAGIGGFVQLALDWRDMLGNRTWSPFDDDAPDNAYPLNSPPSPVGFTDDVIGLGQWPSTLYDHYFAQGDAGPQLVIEWSFDPSRYQPDETVLAAGAGVSAWQRNAAADRQVFANLYYQLLQTGHDGTPATVMETVSSLGDTRPQAITPAEAGAVLDYVLTAWRYVNQVLAGDGRLPPPADLPQPVRITRTIDTQRIGGITEIQAAFWVRRRDGSVLANFRDEDSARVAATAIGPRLASGTDTDPRYTLHWYTAQFHAAFDLPYFQLRLATGVPRRDIGTGQGQTSLWAVRLGKQAGQPYWYEVRNPAIFFAPAPLSPALIHAPDVTLYSYTPDGGLSPTPDRTQSFTDIDLDVWARQVLTAIDGLLAPGYAVPAFLVDQKGGTDYLQRVLDTKYKLAAAIILGVTNVLRDPPLDPEKNAANFRAAREKLRQQLLIKLENAYTVDAIVQHEVAVTAAPATGQFPPQLYGNPHTAGDTTAANDFSTGAFKVQLHDGTSLLTYVFRAREAIRQAHLPLTLAYRPTHIEHEIGPVPGISEYKASSWLTFVDPLPPMPLAGGTAVEIDVPIPLRAYPTPPSLQNQAFLPAEAGPDPTTTLEKAKEWTFRFLYSQVHAAQDRIDAVVRLNVPEQAGGRLAKGDPENLVVRLARISSLLAPIQQVLATDLLAVTLATGVDTPAFQRAQKALAALATLTDDLDKAWSNWVLPLDQRARLHAGETGQELPFSVGEDFVIRDGLAVLRVTVAYPAGLLPGIPGPPIVTFDGFQPEAVDPREAAALAADGERREDLAGALRHMLGDGADIERKAWIYRKIDPGAEAPAYLTWDQARQMPGRRIDLAALDAIRYQNAWARLRITRNAELVGPDNPTREAFIYRTPQVQFKNKLTPLLDTTREIDVARVPSGTPERRTLAAHLTALLAAFFKGSPSQAQLVKLEVRYAYALGAEAGQPGIQLPVLLVPPTELKIPADWRGLWAPGATEQVPAATFIVALAQRLREWHAATAPSRQQARFLLDLSAFSALSQNNQPLVRVRNLTLPVADVTDL